MSALNDESLQNPFIKKYLHKCGVKTKWKRSFKKMKNFNLTTRKLKSVKPSKSFKPSRTLKVISKPLSEHENEIKRINRDQMMLKNFYNENFKDWLHHDDIFEN